MDVGVGPGYMFEANTAQLRLASWVGGHGAENSCFCCIMHWSPHEFSFFRVPRTCIQSSKVLIRNIKPRGHTVCMSAKLCTHADITST